MVIIEIIFAVCIGITLLLTAYKIGIAIANSRQTEHFRCLYCGLLVIGAQSMDKMVHILCIERAPADIEAMKKQVVPEDEYFVAYSRLERKPGESFEKFNYDPGTGTWWMNRWTLYRNGETIASNAEKSKSTAENGARMAEALDRHKRKAASLRSK